MRKIDSLLVEYGDSHQNKTNKLIHWFCVPAIFFSVVGLVFSIPSGFLADQLPFLGDFANWATLTLFLVLIYYISLSPALVPDVCIIVKKHVHDVTLADSRHLKIPTDLRSEFIVEDRFRFRKGYRIH